MHAVEIARLDIGASRRADVCLIKANEATLPAGNGGVVVTLTVNGFAVLHAVVIVRAQIRRFAFSIEICLQLRDKALLGLVPTPFVKVVKDGFALRLRSEEHTSELQSLMRISY